MARNFDEIISDIYQNTNTIKVIQEWPIIFMADTLCIITSASFQPKKYQPCGCYLRIYYI